MESTQVILKPLVTEKSTWQGERHNRYAFHVHPTASKIEIRQAVEDIYKVRVVAVAVQIRPGKNRRSKVGYVTTNPWKRALVELHPEDRIELF
jgi:large subunit ribosomal protein L23